MTTNPHHRPAGSESRTPAGAGDAEREAREVRRLRAWFTLADAIEEEIQEGRTIPCVAMPFLYDTVQRPRRRHHDARGTAPDTGESDLQLRRRLCSNCPVLATCVAYADIAPEVSGFLPTSDLMNTTPDDLEERRIA